MLLAEPAVDRQLLVRHAHVDLVRLDIVFRDRFELGRRSRVDEPARGRKGERERTVRRKAGVEGKMASFLEKTHSCKTGSSNASLAQLMKRFKSTLEMDPIGLMSADEQSYLVK